MLFELQPLLHHLLVLYKPFSEQSAYVSPMYANVLSYNGLMATLRQRDENVNGDENCPIHIGPLIHSAEPLHIPSGRDIDGG